MENTIPPVLSDSPPPLDPDLDDNDDLGFGNFRVAVDLGLDLSDSSRNSPEAWNPTLDQFEDKNQRNTSISPLASLSGDDRRYQEITKSTIPPGDSSTVDNVDLLANSHSHSSDSRAEEVPGCDKLSHSSLDNPDSSEILKELDSIPFSTYDICDIGLEARTSPEGADADYPSEFQPIPASSLEVDPTILKLEELADLEPSELSDCVKIDRIESLCVPASEPPVEVIADTTENQPEEIIDDDFDDFADFTDFSSQPSQEPAPAAPPTTTDPPKTSIEDASPDDFDDFDDFECAVPEVTQPPTTQMHVGSVEDRLAAIFLLPGKNEEQHSEEPALTVCLNTCLDDSSSVWGHLKDLDTSPALALQWPASSASRRLLAALSVDSRNILVGQRWNPMLPRYAANLSGVPLEPVIAAPEPVPPAPVANFDRPPAEDVVPAAQFDWTGSGLTNPLDSSPSSLLDLDFLIKFDNVSSSPNAASAVWPDESSVEKEATLRDRPSELTLKGKPSIEELPPEVAAPQYFPPSTDILMPTPVSTQVPATDNLIVSQFSAPIEREDLNSLSWTSTPPGPMMTISSHFDSLWGTEDACRKSEVTTNLSSIADPSSRPADKACLSPEACRVVESLPDLSFLSARNLLYTANENLSRFHATHARN